TLLSVQENNNLQSATSIPNLGGRRNVYKEQVETADDQTIINGLAQEKLTRLSQITSTLEDFYTAIRPFHDDDDIYTMRHVVTDNLNNAFKGDGKFSEIEWDFPLHHSELMRHSMRSVIPVT